MSEAYLLDTTAILALYRDEAGADTVEGLFDKRERDGTEVLVSSVTLFEIMSMALAEQGEDKAFRLLLDIRGLDMREVWPDDSILWTAARLKQAGLSGSGALIAASAIAKEAVLVHRRSEYGRLGETGHMLPGLKALDIVSSSSKRGQAGR
jgi:predicted nucleic acid-binding protein